MEISSYFPVWNQLTRQQQEKITQNASFRKVEKGTVLHNGSADCAGLFLISSGHIYFQMKVVKSHCIVSLKWIYACFLRRA